MPELNRAPVEFPVIDMQTGMLSLKWRQYFDQFQRGLGGAFPDASAGKLAQVNSDQTGYEATSAPSIASLALTGAVPAMLAAATRYIGAAALHLITGYTVAAGGENSINFTGGLTAAFDIYLLPYSLAPENDNVTLFLRFGVGGSYNSGASAYAWSAFAAGGGGTGLANDTADSEIEMSTTGIGNATGEQSFGMAILFMPASGSGYKGVVNLAGQVLATGVDVLEVTMGRLLTATAQSDVQLLLSSGQIAEGSKAALYGVAPL